MWVCWVCSFMRLFTGAETLKHTSYMRWWRQNMLCLPNGTCKSVVLNISLLHRFVFFWVCMFSAITLFAITIFIALLRQYGLVWIVYMCVIRVFMVPTYGIVVTVQNMHVPLNSLCDLHCAMHSWSAICSSALLWFRMVTDCVCYNILWNHASRNGAPHR